MHRPKVTTRSGDFSLRSPKFPDRPGRENRVHFSYALSYALDRLRYLRHGIAAVLVFTGAKMIGSEWVHISLGVSVGIIRLVLGVTIAVSMWPADQGDSVTVTLPVSPL